MPDLGKDMERSWDKGGTTRDVLAPYDVELLRIYSDINRVRERSKLDKEYRRAVINRYKAGARRDREEAEIIRDSLEEA